MKTLSYVLRECRYYAARACAQLFTRETAIGAAVGLGVLFGAQIVLRAAAALVVAMGW